MKKGIYLLLTFVVGLFICCSSVNAAKELTCVYDRAKNAVSDAINDSLNLNYYTTMFIQNKEGKMYYYVIEADASDIPDINRSGWVYYSEVTENSINFIFETDYYDSGSKALTACPKYSSAFKKNSKDVTFYDSKNNAKELDENLSCENCLPYIMGGKSIHEEEISNIKKASWNSKCSYCKGDNKNCLDLYFNENELFVDNHREKTKAEELDFGIKEIKENYGYACPPTLYESYDSIYTSLVPEKTHFTAKYSLIKPNDSNKYNVPVCSSLSDSAVMIQSCTVYYLYELKLNKSNSIDYKGYNGEPGSIFDGDDIDNCNDLIDEDIRKILNDIMNFVKILVPILLLGFGVFDFTRAVFSNSVDDMSKHKKRFFKRIIAAVIVFLVPIFVNLLLTVANEVWAYINPTSCL